MNLWLYLQYGLMFFCGQALHLLLVKWPALEQRAGAANKVFSFKEWWIKDWKAIIVTNVIGLMVAIGLDELLHWKPEVANAVKWFFAGVGAFGSTIAMKYFSRYDKSLTKLLDINSNITAHFIGEAPKTAEEAAFKGSSLIGQDVTKPPKP